MTKGQPTYDDGYYDGYRAGRYIALVEAAEDALKNHPSWNGAGAAVRNRMLFLAEQERESAGDSNAG